MKDYRYLEYIIFFLCSLTVSYLGELNTNCSGLFYLLAIFCLYVLILFLIKKNCFYDAFLKKINYKEHIVEKTKFFHNLYTVFAFSPLPVIILNSKLEQIWKNENFSLMQEDFFQGKSFFEILEKDFVKELNLFSINNEINKKSPFEVRLKSSDFVLLVYFSEFEIFYEKFVLITIFDITKNKILESDFVHLQKLQMLGHFLSSIIHDFNNLLTAIIGFSDILLTKNSSKSNSYEDIIQIKKNAIRSSNLVKKLLAFSRKETTIPKLINVTTCISDLYQLIKKLLGEKISLSIEQEEPCFIKIDKTQFQQVIINLSVNAKDSIVSSTKKRKNEGFLKISTHVIKIAAGDEILNYYSPKNGSELKVGKYVLVKIEDNGEGMKQNILEKIFNPFFSTKSNGVGTGLGLSTIVDIIESVSGFIKVKTIFGEGTSFYLFFNLGKKVALQIDKKDDLSMKNNNDNYMKIPNNNKNIKILVVEDENPVRLVTIQALKYNGYEVLDSSNGGDALKILEQNPDIDLIITDFMMGRMDGVELVKNIRKKYKKLKIIITSGYTENALLYVKEHQCEFLNKPYSLKTLNEKVEEILK